jgi:hypothetical protein
VLTVVAGYHVFVANICEKIFIVLVGSKTGRLEGNLTAEGLRSFGLLFVASLYSLSLSCFTHWVIRTVTYNLNFPLESLGVQ